MYDANTKRVVNNEEEADLRRGEEKDSRLARVLRDIANDVQVGIELEEDHPSAHENGMILGGLSMQPSIQGGKKTLS